MKLTATIHTPAGQSPALLAALAQSRANRATPTQDAPTDVPSPAASGVRARLTQRLGLSDPNSSNEEIFAALDGTLAAAKAKRTQADLTDALYNAAWGEPRTTPEPLTFVSAEDAALYTIAFGKPMGA